MKKIKSFVFGTIMLSCTCLTLITCSKKDISKNVPKGILSLNVGITISVFDVYNNLKAATDSFSITIYNADDKVVANYAYATDIPDSIELPAGSYYVIASSGNNDVAAFNDPYYMGNSGNFTIRAGQTSTVDVTCTLTNVMVTVIYSDNVKNYYSSYSTDVSNSGGDLLFNENESRPGFFNTGPLHIKADLQYTDGTGNLQTKTLTGDIAAPRAGKHYEIHIDGAPTNGNSIINIHMNDTVETEVVNINEEGQSSGGLTYGDLLITEVMCNPSALPDASGEWIELYNNSAKTINLKDLIIRRDSTADVHQINSDVNVSPGSYVVLATTDSATDHVDYVYGSAINLINTGPKLSISTYGTDGTDGTLLCAVDFGDSSFVKIASGKALQLDPSVHNADDAKLGTNWCNASTAYSTGDYGTPGTANTNCTP